MPLPHRLPCEPFSSTRKAPASQASASQPADGTIQYHYVVVLSKPGKADQARDALQKLLKLNTEPEIKSQAQLLLVNLGGRR